MQTMRNKVRLYFGYELYTALVMAPSMIQPILSSESTINAKVRRDELSGLSFIALLAMTPPERFVRPFYLTTSYIQSLPVPLAPCPYCEETEKDDA